MTLLVTGALAAGETPTKPSTQGPTTTAAPAQPSGSKSSPTPPATAPAPATQTPPKHPATGAAGAQTGTAQIPEGRGPKPDPKKPTKSEKMIDLNNASATELKTLPGVGDAEAQKIIASRPFNSKAELVTKAGLPEGVYIGARHRVELKKMKQPAAKTARTNVASDKKKPDKQPSEAKPADTKKSETQQSEAKK